MDPPRFLRQRISFGAVQGGTFRTVATIGLDIARQIVQFQGAGAEGRPVSTKAVTSEPVVGFFAGLPPCVVGMEACCGVHYGVA
jgi:hypothetical protein